MRSHKIQTVISGVQVPGERHLDLVNGGNLLTGHSSRKHAQEAEITLPQPLAEGVYEFCRDYLTDPLAFYDCHGAIGFIMGWQRPIKKERPIYAPNYNLSAVDATTIKPGKAYELGHGKECFRHSVLAVDARPDGAVLSVLGIQDPLLLAPVKGLMDVYGTRTIYLLTPRPEQQPGTARPWDNSKSV